MVDHKKSVPHQKSGSKKPRARPKHHKTVRAIYVLFAIIGVMEVLHMGWSTWFSEEAKAIAEGLSTVVVAIGHLAELAE